MGPWIAILKAMETIKNLKVYQILNKAFMAKKKVNPSYSQRALARDLGTSPVFVTNILTGKKNVPAARFKRIFKVLDMDITSQTELMRAAILESLPSNDLRNMAKLSLTKAPSMEKYTREESHKFGILKNWYTIAILNYIECSGLDQSNKNIADYFGLSIPQVTETIENLQVHGFIKFENGRYQKTDQHSYFPTTKSNDDVRNFHKQMIQKSSSELSKTSKEDFEKRLITGFTVSVNAEKIEIAKKMISEFLGEISGILSEGECQEVYQCNIQLFPLKAKGNQK